MKFAQQERKDIGMQAAPLIDVVFLLIIFFLLTSIFRVEKELASPLPGVAKKSEEKALNQVLIRIAPDGSVFIHKKEYDSASAEELPELRAMLREFKNFYEDPIVIILPEKKVKYERVMNVLDTCVAAKIKKISFAGRR